MKRSISLRIITFLLMLFAVFLLSTWTSFRINQQVDSAIRTVTDSYMDLEAQLVQVSSSVDAVESDTKMMSIDISGTTYMMTKSFEEDVSSGRENLKAMETACKSLNEDQLWDKFETWENYVELYFQRSEAMRTEYLAGNTAKSYLAYALVRDARLKMQSSNEAFQETLKSCISNQKELVMQVTQQATTMTYASLVLFVLVCALVVFMVLQTITLPMKRGNRKLKLILDDIEQSKGDLSLRIPKKYTDEYGQMVDGVNHFIESLQSIMLSIRDQSATLDHLSADISEKVLSCNNSASDMSSVMEELSASMQSISDTLERFKADAQTVLDSAGEIMNSAKSGDQMVQEIHTRAENISEETRKNKADALQMLSNIEESMKKAISDSEAVRDIQELTEKILEISKQTNVLALNASIEAGRAGEAGRGFGVVADEIRVLANNTKQTANEIQKISGVVMNSVGELVENSNGLMSYISKDIMNNFDGFVEMADQYRADAGSIKGFLTTFSSRSTELLGVADSLADGVNTVSTTVQQCTVGVTESSNSITTLVSEVGAIVTDVEGNQKIVDELSQEVGKFTNLEGKEDLEKPRLFKRKTKRGVQHE